ncbi:MAG TPA: DeoR/GlpR family DNA-binding transcription regulator [Pyrinomonadaceae bacterium]|jgi:DeoR family transcriptional regulator of aga operon|nr:DeoR/GlpR family DNA-binding transcription regulator [Pyrinomonadaceae bacterium]
MLTEERRGAIVSLLHENGKVQVKELSKRFNISEVTIRTDLKELHQRGLVYKSHGGAVLPTLVAGEPTLYEKSVENAIEKSKIGAAAAEFVNDGETIILDSGSTTHEIAKRLKERQDLTVITNGINIATELAGHRGIQIILLGGVMRHSSISIVGHFAEEMLSQLTADKLFMAADGCTLEFGISTPKFEESRINQAMVAIAREKYLTADSSKFGRNSLSRIVSLWDMDGVISDTGLTEEYQAEIAAHGLKLVLV